MIKLAPRLFGMFKTLAGLPQDLLALPVQLSAHARSRPRADRIATAGNEQHPRRRSNRAKISHHTFYATLLDEMAHHVGADR